MAQGFNNGTYEIYWYKDQQGTPNAPQSPSTSMAQSPTDKGMMTRRSAALGIAAMAGARVISTLRTEIAATTGNEVLQTDINNIVTGIGYITAVAVGGVTAAAGLVVSAGVSEIVRQRTLMRNNRAIEYNNKLRGARINYGQGGVY